MFSCIENLKRERLVFMQLLWIKIIGIELAIRSTM